MFFVREIVMLASLDASKTHEKSQGPIYGCFDRDSPRSPQELNESGLLYGVVLRGLCFMSWHWALAVVKRLGPGIL